ncbi:MAG: phosphoribosylaminoimidazolesuccinocarboxamide synthase [Treponema sp.]|nr:phosphoribosylaminoimidazolesuccinocarboxamide synthase [Treponema sp.]
MDDVLYEGKSKIVCTGRDESTLLIRFKDSATAFNGEKKAELPGKAQLNAAISNIIFNYLAQHGIQSHVIEVIDKTSVLVKKADIIMVEIIVRNIAAGSFSKKFGIAEGTVLHNTAIEFCIKSDDLGDPMINESQITAIGLAQPQELAEMIQQSLKINDLLYALFAKAGIKLVDFKLEFGRCGGQIILCDEISPDSCRLWDSETEKKLDKDRFRLDLGNVLDAYREVLGRLQNV